MDQFKCAVEEISNKNNSEQDGNNDRKVVTNHACGDCAAEFTNNRHLSNHYKSNHNEGFKYSCDECDFKTSIQQSLIPHQKAKHKGVIYFCKQCNST